MFKSNFCISYGKDFYYSLQSIVCLIVDEVCWTKDFCFIVHIVPFAVLNVWADLESTKMYTFKIYKIKR